MIIAAVLSIVISLMEFNNGLKPFVVEKVEAVVEAVGQDINYAIEVGVPFDQIRGLDDYISNLISDHPEIEQIKGSHSSKIKNILGYSSREEIIHKDDLVKI